MLLELHVAPGREPRPQKCRANPLAEARLRQEEEVVGGAVQDDERSDHARLGREEESLAGLPRRKRLDVVRHHRLQVGRRVRSAHADEVAWAGGDERRRDRHRV
jgi:hypothetical protein